MLSFQNNTPTQNGTLHRGVPYPKRRHGRRFVADVLLRHDAEGVHPWGEGAGIPHAPDKYSEWKMLQWKPPEFARAPRESSSNVAVARKRLG
ncbi:unnamed protein product [Sphenostylis stenocarpa]|uniref:Uncharacterized protein n=1 Tax=Sphenostylis stenocarpa TaxID=92480 RepID=A0AA86S443_9FABA|nr:unnamed protein product [Sphenostylis stenocarpa]